MLLYPGSEVPEIQKAVRGTSKRSLIRFFVSLEPLIQGNAAQTCLENMFPRHF